MRSPCSVTSRLRSPRTSSTATRPCVRPDVDPGQARVGDARHRFTRRASKSLDERRTQSDVTTRPNAFVFVGHSSGGEYVRIFAGRYPEQVAGMVLLDA